jgi:hypothetical protein
MEMASDVKGVFLMEMAYENEFIATWFLDSEQSLGLASDGKGFFNGSGLRK